MAQLRKEKRRSDRLLYQMLPPSIACQLKEKKQVRSLKKIFIVNSMSSMNGTVI